MSSLIKKFEDELNTAVFTTRFVLWENSPILYVYHYDDGFWQFSGSEDDVQDEDFKVVALEKIIKRDPTVQEVADLPYEWEARRESVGSSWEIRRQNNEEIVNI